MARQAQLLVADEIYFNLWGKALLHGIYHGDLVINGETSQAPQLVFFFMLETDLSDPFRNLQVEVKLPGNDPIRVPVLITYPAPPSTIQQGRTRLFYRHPLLIPQPMLRLGRIEAKAIHESGEIEIGAPWISNPQPTVQPN